MSKVLLALTSVALLGLSGCADLHVNKPGGAKASAAATPAISTEAQNALKQAQEDVKQAKGKYALWTTAADALKKAEEAAKKGDSATVIKEAGEASYFVRKGLAQLNYPQIKVGE